MSPEEALRRALVALWTGDSAVSSLIGNRVFDRVKAGAEFPYVEFGETQLIDEDAACHERFQAYQTVHVWSRALGNLEAFAIANALRKAVRAADFASALDTSGVAILRHESTRVFDDPDGLTTHGVVTFHTVIDPQ